MSFMPESEVEELTLDWLRTLGYQVLHGPSIGPGRFPTRLAITRRERG